MSGRLARAHLDVAAIERSAGAVPGPRDREVIVAAGLTTVGDSDLERDLLGAVDDAVPRMAASFANTCRRVRAVDLSRTPAALSW